MSDTITSGFWQEIPCDETPFRPSRCTCAGYDVYGDLIQHADAMSYLYLLFKREAPNREALALLNRLFMVLGNAGPRDHSVQAAMSAAAGGAGAAASLIAALSVSAGQLFGAREVFTLLLKLRECERELSKWSAYYEQDWIALAKATGFSEVWPHPEHPPGFDAHTSSTIQPVEQALKALAIISPGTCLPWLQENLRALEAMTHMGLSLSWVAAAALQDLNFDPEEGEMLYLLLRLPGAAAHALEQRERGLKDFPFYADGIVLIPD